MWGVIGAIALGGAIDAWAQLRAGDEASASARRAGRRTAAAFERSAAETFQMGEDQVFMSKIKSRNVTGEAKLVQGGSGLEGGEDALRTSAYFSELDAAALRVDARRKAWGMIDQAQYALESSEEQAKTLKRQARWGAVRSIIGAGAQGMTAYAYAKGGGGAGRTTPSYDWEGD